MRSDSRGDLAADGLSPCRVLIVDSHDSVRLSLSRLLERRSNWCVVGEAACVADGLRLTHERLPHVAIVDPCLGKIDGIELTRTLTALAPEVRIVGYSFHDDGLTVSRFIEAGGNGFVSKHESSDALIEAIEQALAGRIRIAFREAETSHGQGRETERHA